MILQTAFRTGSLVAFNIDRVIIWRPDSDDNVVVLVDGCDDEFFLDLSYAEFMNVMSISQAKSESFEKNHVYLTHDKKGKLPEALIVSHSEIHIYLT